MMLSGFSNWTQKLKQNFKDFRLQWKKPQTKLCENIVILIRKQWAIIKKTKIEIQKTSINFAKKLNKYQLNENF